MFFLAMLIASVLLDGAVRPRSRRRRRGPGLLLHTLVMTGLFGLFLAGSGSMAVAAALATASIALVATASNAKFAMLGEPLVFSDFALIVAVFRHPRFYFTAISAVQRWMLGFAVAAALLVLALLFSPRVMPHLTGMALLLCAGGGLAVLLRGRALDPLAPVPDLDRDVARYGLVATLLLYWWRCRHSVAPPAMPPLPMASTTAPDRIIIIQCESFADPVALTGDPAHALPGLAHARATAWQHGNLAVSGFGAYTMRTEYGVLFGRDEAELGFRRFDPFLTAFDEASYAIPARLSGAGYAATFVHPHDLRFYGRNRLMPAMGFDRLIGEERFIATTRAGRYVDDRTLGATLRDLAGAADGRAVIYAVTMENHGPWETDDTADSAGRLASYLRHLRNSDAMLSDLTAWLAADGRPALLVFFGDHRPSIPGVSMPGGARHTPYVMLRFGPGGTPIGSGARVDLTPAQLHHAVLACVSGPAA